MSARFGFFALGFVVLAGCTFPVRQQVDTLLCDRANLSVDTPTAAEIEAEKETKQTPATKNEQPKKPLTLQERLPVPPDVPGADAPMIQMPKGKPFEKAVDALIKKYFPPIPKLKREPAFPPNVTGQPLSLSDLQKIAFTSSPMLKQAAADIEAARGAAIQAGVYPNPSLGYTSTGNGPSGGPTYGVFYSQTIKTMGKLKLAQAAALMDLQNAELAYRRAEADLMANVRLGYYGVLIADTSVRANSGLVELTDEVYRVMVDQLKGGLVAPYEPLQLKVFSEQARNNLFQARNARMLAWRQLASALGVPHMPPTALAGQVVRPAPKLDFEKGLQHILTKHTEVLTAEASIAKARYSLRLAQAAPYPDVNVQASVQVDSTPPGPSRLFPTVQVGVPVPLFDQNKGGIRQAQANLVRANEEPRRVQADLTVRYSEAYRRYEESRVMLERYRKEILPKQVQAFRAALARHAEAGFPFNDLINSEQTLIAVVGSYLTVLQGQWQAAVDLSSILQTHQLYQMTQELENEPSLELDELLKLPCPLPCAPAAPEPTRKSFGMPPTTAPLSRLDAPVPSGTAVTFLAPSVLAAPTVPAAPADRLVDHRNTVAAPTTSTVR